MDQNQKDLELMQKVMHMFGAQLAQQYEQKAPDMTADEIYESSDFFPDFNPEKQYLNYKSGFVCKSPSGNLVKLIQPYDSTIFTDPPEELDSQWGFYWADEPKYAKPFISLATSPYSKGNVCTYNGRVWRSGMDNNTWAPGTENIPWEDLGPTEQYI